MEALTLALAQFHFIRPEWFWALLPTLFIVLFCWRQFRSSASWQQIIAPELLQHLLDQKQTGSPPQPCPVVTGHLVNRPFGSSWPHLAEANTTRTSKTGCPGHCAGLVIVHVRRGC